MKKNFYPFILIFFLTGSVEKSFAQILNPSFEFWTAGNPDNWKCNNGSGGYTWVTQIINPHEGYQALKSEVLNVGAAVGSPLILGSDGKGVHTNTPPSAIHGWYILNSVSGDFISLSSGMFLGSTAYGVGAMQVNTATTTYKEFVLNMNYALNGGVPGGDSLILTFSISGAGATVHEGTYFILDDLSFGSVSTEVNNPVSPIVVSLEHIVPNPAMDKINIIYTLSSESPVTLEIFDLLGRKVKTLVYENQTPGRYKAILDVKEFLSGNYFCRLTASGNILSEKLSVVK